MREKNAQSRNKYSSDLWLPQDDLFLKKNIPAQGHLNWKQISKKFNEKAPHRQKTPRQLRERYTNHSRFENQSDILRQWSPSETEFFFQLYLQFGPRWKQIASKMDNRYESSQLRSENNLKNKFYGSLRKLLKKINDSSRQNIPSYTKPLKYEALVRVMEIQKTKFSLAGSFDTKIGTLKKQIVAYCEKEETTQNTNEFLDFIQALHQFNIRTRFYRVKGKKNKSLNIQRNKKKAKIEPKLGQQCLMEVTEEQNRKQGGFIWGKSRKTIFPTTENCEIDMAACISYYVDAVRLIAQGGSAAEKREIHELINCVGI